MSEKSKNPLYVVKGKNVEMASGLFDMLIKRFDLAPVVAMLQQLLSMLLAQVNSYPLLAQVKTLVDVVLAQLQPLMGRFTRA
jgi:hypothetical protein